MKVYGSECIDQCFLEFDASWRSVSWFTHLPLHPWGKRLRYPLDIRQSGPQRSSERYGKVNILDPTVLEFRPLDHPARSQSLYRQRYRGSCNIVSD
jgi:hypothetical protein